MKFRPCIDIHNGKVKQIVGGSLIDKGDQATENFASENGGDFFANLYKSDGLRGGHIIMLNPSSSPYFAETKRQALLALSAYPGGMQIGGGINEKNAKEYIEAGASHVVVTSYVFKDGVILFENLKKLVDAVGAEHLVLDLSCRKKEDGNYYVVTNRWQTFTDVKVDVSLMNELKQYCSEFLVHGVDVEGKASGVALDLVEILAQCEGIPITYAGGIGSLDDLEKFRLASEGKLDFTIGSALDLFGGNIPYDVIKHF